MRFLLSSPFPFSDLNKPTNLYGHSWVLVVVAFFLAQLESILGTADDAAAASFTPQSTAQQLQSGGQPILLAANEIRVYRL